MKQSEVEVGQEYGWASYEGARQVRVTLVEKNVKSKDWQGHMKTQQRVQRHDGDRKIFDVPTRELRNPWSVEAAKRRAQRENHFAMRASSQASREEHAGLALRANALLNALGVEDVPQDFRPGTHETAEEIGAHLADLGFHVLERDFYSSTQIVVLAADDSVVEHARFGAALTIPKTAVAPLVEAAEVFL